MNGRSAPGPTPPRGPRLGALVGAAAALHALFDAVLYRVPLARPPYLRLEDAPEGFQFLSPVAVSVAASCVSGLIAAMMVSALDPPRRRLGTIAALVTGFWIFSALLTRAVWLATPWPVTLAAVACGVPRGLAVGWAAARLARPAPGAAAASP